MAWIELPGRRKAKEKHYYDSSTNRFRAIFTIAHHHYKNDGDEFDVRQINGKNNNNG